MNEVSSKEIAVFGGGCFWCTEAVYKMLKGVISVIPGYAGGEKDNPTYEEVSSGKTGHAEVIKIEFNPKIISYRDLLTVFFAVHDPTTLNRQGNDVGTQYRSIILYKSPEQKRLAGEFIKEIDEPDSRVVTEVELLGKFYGAEKYHRDYYFKNSSHPYCQLIISPKLEKLRDEFERLIKEAK